MQGSGVRFEVFTTGNVSNTNGILDCSVDPAGDEALGGIFHPLKEERNGVVNPYADPERGLIHDIAAKNNLGLLESQIQTELLMDLGGPNSLIGRALFAYEINPGFITKRN